MRPPKDRRPRFVLDQNFPAPILSAANLDTWLPEFEIVSVREHDPRLSRDFEDWQVILGCSQTGAEGFISDDAAMLDNPRVIAVVEQTKMTLVICAEIGHDPIAATGLLLAHLPRVAKRHRSDRPQIWKIRPTEQREKDLSEFKDRIERNSGMRVDDFRLSTQSLQEPLLPPTGP
jgi:hypothetical protein